MHNAYRKNASYLIQRIKFGAKNSKNALKKMEELTAEEEIRGQRRADKMNSFGYELLT